MCELQNLWRGSETGCKTLKRILLRKYIQNCYDLDCVCDICNKTKTVGFVHKGVLLNRQLDNKIKILLNIACNKEVTTVTHAKLPRNRSYSFRTDGKMCVVCRPQLRRVLENAIFKLILQISSKRLVVVKRSVHEKYDFNCLNKTAVTTIYIIRIKIIWCLSKYLFSCCYIECGN